MAKTPTKRYHCNDFLPILRELRPQKKFITDYPEAFYLKFSTDQSESVALLEKWAGQDGLKPLKRIMTEAINNPYWKTEEIPDEIQRGFQVVSTFGTQI